MLNSKTKYALKALANLARKSSRQPVLIAELSREEKIPKKFLERILLDLKGHGILQSRMGKGGGYFLRKRPSDVSVGEIVRIMDGPLAPVSCVSETAYERCKECKSEAGCCVRSVMKEVRDAMAKILDGTSVADLAARADTFSGKNNLLSFEI